MKLTAQHCGDKTTRGMDIKLLVRLCKDCLVEQITTLVELDPPIGVDADGKLVEVDVELLRARYACYNAVEYNPATRNLCRDRGGFVYRPHAAVIRARINAIIDAADSDDDEDMWDELTELGEEGAKRFEDIRKVRQSSRGLLLTL